MKRSIRNSLPALCTLVLGLLTCGTGVYLLGLRPPFLPEDGRFTGVAARELPDPFLRWLGIVFRTWGGFVFGLGLCLIGVAGFLFRGRSIWLRGGVAAGVLVAFGSFLLSNIQLHSDVVWFIAILFANAVACATLLLAKPSADD